MQSQEAKSTTSIINMTATEMARKIRSGELSSQEVVEAHIKRIEQVNKKLNAVVIKLFDNARTQAKKADQDIKEGRAVGPLHGVPITIKEQFEVAGTQLCLGVSTQTGRISKTDGPLVARLKEAGAIILGIQNVHPEEAAEVKPQLLRQEDHHWDWGAILEEVFVYRATSREYMA